MISMKLKGINNKHCNSKKTRSISTSKKRKTSKIGSARELRVQYHHVKIPGINLLRRAMYGSHNKKKGKHMIEKLAKVSLNLYVSC